MVLLQGAVFPSALHCQLLPIITCELISSLAVDANLKSSAQPVSFAMSSHPFVFLEVVPRLCIAAFFLSSGISPAGCVTQLSSKSKGTQTENEEHLYPTD